MIIAFDFDGILCKNQFPAIGEPYESMIQCVKEAKALGHEVILWTSRVGAELDAAVKWCQDHGLVFDSINENAPSNVEMYKHLYPNGTRKVYADIYVDDHSLGFVDRRCFMEHDLCIEHFKKVLIRLMRRNKV